MLFLITLVIGITYAAFTLTEVGSENVITTGSISMSYTESTNVISINNALPTSDTDGKVSSNYFDFSVTSNMVTEKDSIITYSILIEPLSSNTLKDDNIKVYLEKISTTNETLLEPKLISKLSNYVLYNTSHTHTSVANSITTKYRLRAWIDYNTDASNWNSVTSYEYKFKVNVNTEESKALLSYDEGTINYEMQKQVKTMNINYKYTNDANVEEDGVVYNNGDNGVFLYDGTDDNDGNYPIYYYRGNVDNNNVLFANMCWKIVRTTSTGGTKLIYNGVPTDGVCDNTGDDSLAFKSVFNENEFSPSDVGYMYGERYEYSSKTISELTGTIIYGNDITYSNGVYSLKDTFSSTDYSTDKTTIESKYHYTCLNSTGTCSSVYYITYFEHSKNIYYLTFTNGDDLESAKTKMFTNTNDSTIKTAIDSWYSTNLTSYTNYLENTIFCNDRTYTEEINFQGQTLNGGAMYSKDTNADSYSFHVAFVNAVIGTPSLQCSNIRDRFSLSATNGGTTGYGNNKLTYSVGLLTADEIDLAGASAYDGTTRTNYLNDGTDSWLFSPVAWDDYDSISGLLDEGSLHLAWVGISAGVRPAVSLQLGTQFKVGTDGSATNPYVVE